MRVNSKGSRASQTQGEAKWCKIAVKGRWNERILKKKDQGRWRQYKNKWAEQLENEAENGV